MILDALPLWDWLQDLFRPHPKPDDGPPDRLGADEEDIVEAARDAARAQERMARAQERHIPKQERRIRDLERRLQVLETLETDLRDVPRE